MRNTWGNLLVEDVRVAALMVGLGIVEAVVVRVEAAALMVGLGIVGAVVVRVEAAALMVGLGIVEAAVVRVETLQEGDTARQILSWMRLVTNQPSLPS